MNDNTLTTLILVGIPAIASLILSIMTRRDTARKDMVAQLQQDNETLRSENRQIKADNREMQMEIDQLRALIAELQRQIVELGGVPIRVVNSYRKIPEEKS